MEWQKGRTDLLLEQLELCYRSTGFRGYWTTQYGHRFSSFSGSTKRIFEDRFWVSGYRFTVQSFRITRFTNCWYTSFEFTGYWGFYLW